MTVDITLAALTACFAWHWGSGREPGWGLWFTLAAAGLTRETGLLLAAACVLAALVKRDYRKSGLLGDSRAAGAGLVRIPPLCDPAHERHASLSSGMAVAPAAARKSRCAQSSHRAIRCSGASVERIVRCP